ncbi:MAG: tRNA 2-thiouridine(34) synthase MnmA [Fuerstiella sp.]|nr:tRNA 2-thiouridine(34) synthase MnmA [Fuerstiella sp.]MCP4859252.1 tRNA 2-thiouridine(34) synthase MnmA [Fuerstiella sp.]
MSKRVVLAMSGGVDSSAAAVLLHRQGYEVIGLFMRSGETEEAACAVSDGGLPPVVATPTHKQGCCGAEDAADARRVADELGIPFHSLNFRDSFTRIKDYFADEYFAGRTPNPCVQCNNWLKFGKLWDFAQQVGADHIATGHYARILKDERSGEYSLHCGNDPQKDQSYVLFGIRRELLGRILLPVGEYQKPAIREYAEEAGLRVAQKKDSYEICFVPNDDYAGFLKRYRGHEGTEGEFVDTAGNVMGHHDGYEKFTVGQRKGLGVAFGQPKFVLRVDAESRQVVLGDREDLASSEVRINGLNWLVETPPQSFDCSVKVRYQQPSRACSVEIIRENEAVVFPDEPILGVAPGQAAVLYDGDRVLGGGWIQSA